MSASGPATVPVVEPSSPLPTLAVSPPSLDSESQEWLRRLRANDSARQDAIASLHALLMRAARFEVARRRPTAGPEVGCDECFIQLDRYVELELAGTDADLVIPGLRAHLEGCPACREEHESLRALVGGEQTR
jgi:hypothetical protein